MVKLQILASKTKADTSAEQIPSIHYSYPDVYQTHTTALPMNFICFIFQWPERRHDVIADGSKINRANWGWGMAWK